VQAYSCEIRALIFWQVGCESSNLIIHLSTTDVYDSKTYLDQESLISPFSFDFMVLIASSDI